MREKLHLCVGGHLDSDSLVAKALAKLRLVARYDFGACVNDHVIHIFFHILPMISRKGLSLLGVFFESTSNSRCLMLNDNFSELQCLYDTVCFTDFPAN